MSVSTTLKRSGHTAYVPTQTPPQADSPPQFQPARLRLARELAQRSQAELVKRTGLSAAAISQYESGSARPSTDAIAKLADSLDVSPAFLTKSVQDTHDGFFRSLRRSTVADRRRARAFAVLIHDLAPEIPDIAQADVPSLPVADLSDQLSPIEAARKTREHWGVPPGRIENMVQLLEAHGIIVVTLPLGSPDVDAFSLPFADHPVVVLGTDKDDRARSRFDAAHELGHLVMHRQHAWGIKAVEDQAHAFAAEFLMPADDIAPELPARADWPKLFDLKMDWHVSLAALLMRARTLGIMAPPDYLNAVKAASARGWRRYEPVDIGAREKTNIADRLEELALTDSRFEWLPASFKKQLVSSQ